MFNLIFVLYGKGLKFVHQNIRGLEANFDHLQGFIESHKEIDVISLSETHLRSDNDCKILKLEGYKFLGNCRKNGAGGGVCICIKENIVLKNAQTSTKPLLKICGSKFRSKTRNQLSLDVVIALQRQLITNQKSMISFSTKT